MTRYENLRDQLKTGDIVLFSGKNDLISETIKLVTLSKWSHVGMVLRQPDYDLVLLWESTTLSNLKDIEDGKAKRGVQLVSLRERLRAYRGDVVIRQLQNISIDENPKMKTALLDFRTEVRDRPFEDGWLALLKSAVDYFGRFSKNQEDLSSLFCSELVAEAYQRMGLLAEVPDGEPSNEYTPIDFSEKKKLPLLKGATLGPEIVVTI